MSLTLDIIDTKGKKIDSVDLAEKVFSVKRLSAVVHEVVTAYQANQRRGTHSTKTRAEVSGGGAKPWKQKGTGRARSGSSRSPLWRHGGVVFGPKPRSYNKAVPTTKRHLALKSVLSDYAREGRLQVVDSIKVSEPKTKHVADIIKAMSMPKKTLIIIDQKDDNLLRAGRNIQGIGFSSAANLNAYDVLLSHHLVFTRSALDQIIKRLSGSSEEKVAEN